MGRSLVQFGLQRRTLRKEIGDEVVDEAEEEEEEEEGYGIIEYFVDRVEEDGVLWWGVHWEGTHEHAWCEDTNIPRILIYNKMRTAGAKGQFFLRFNLKSKNKNRGTGCKTKGKDRKGGPSSVGALLFFGMARNELFRFFVVRAVTKLCTNHNEQIYALGQSKR